MKIANKVLDDWFKRALSYGQINDSFMEVKLGTAQHDAWIRYFAQLGVTPLTLRRDSWTAPCEWPSQFKTTFK